MSEQDGEQIKTENNKNNMYVAVACMINKIQPEKNTSRDTSEEPQELARNEDIYLKITSGYNTEKYIK